MEHRQENQTMDGKFIPMTSLTNGLVQQVAEGVFPTPFKSSILRWFGQATILS